MSFDLEKLNAEIQQVFGEPWAKFEKERHELEILHGRYGRKVTRRSSLAMKQDFLYSILTSEHIGANEDNRNAREIAGAKFSICFSMTEEAIERELVVRGHALQ